VRAALDANVLVSAALSQAGAPAALLERCLLGEFELVVSARLLAEVERALAYPKIRARLAADDAAAFVSMLRELAEVADDPEQGSAIRSRDPGDDYLVALARAERATLVSGDAHLLGLRKAIPVVSPREFLDSL